MTDLLATAVRHHREGRYREAEALYRRVLDAEPGHAEALHLLGLLGHETGHHAEAAALIRRAIAAAPGRPLYHFNLGVVLAAAGEAAGAEAAYRAALALAPEHADAHNNLGLVLEGCGRGAEALAAFRAAAAHAPGHAEARANLGRRLLEAGDAAAAEASFRAALGLAPEMPEAHFGLGTVQLARGRHADATRSFDAALAHNPDLDGALYNRGQAHYALRRLDRAEADFRAVLAQQADHAGALNSLGAVLVKQARIDEAAHLFRQGREQHPGDERFPVNLASALEQLNDLDGAVAAARQALEGGTDSPALHLALARLDHRFDRLDEAKARLEALLERPLGDEDRTEALFELGHVLDRLGAPATAFPAFAEAKALQGRSPAAGRFDPDRFLAQVAANRAWFTKARLKALSARAPRAEEPAPVFFVGFPRSGTTLVERALKAHPRVVTTEERSPLARVLQVLRREEDLPQALETWSGERIAEVRAKVRAEAEQTLGPLDGRVLIDKLPLNLVDLGFANLVFPEARVIVALRDPRDVCLSCLMQRFALNDAMAGFLDLERTARTYAAVMDLWLAYREALTLPWHEYRYEDLVEDFEGVLGGLLAFTGLDWHEDVARFRDLDHGQVIATPSYRQVTREIYKGSVGRWRSCAEFLAPVRATLGPYVTEFGYPEA